MKILSIDPGLVCMAWTMNKVERIPDTERYNIQVVDWGFVDLTGGVGRKITQTALTINTVRWTLAHWQLFNDAEVILIEQQYLQPGKGVFMPYIVQQALYVQCIHYRDPDLVRLINPGAVRQKFKFSGGGHAANKREAVQRFSHLIPECVGQQRTHDIIDCVLMVKYHLNDFT